LADFAYTHVAIYAFSGGQFVFQSAGPLSGTLTDNETTPPDGEDRTIPEMQLLRVADLRYLSTP
jgi:hypothetical protein